MKQEDLKRVIIEELNKLREAMPLPLDDEDEGDRFTADQREQDARLENPDLYYGDEGDAKEKMAARSSTDRAKELMHAVEAGAAAVRSVEDSDLLTADALQAAKAAMLEDPDATGDDVEDAIYAALYYDYFPEMLREGDVEDKADKDKADKDKADKEMHRRLAKSRAGVERSRAAIRSTGYARGSRPHSPKGSRTGPRKRFDKV